MMKELAIDTTDSRQNNIDTKFVILMASLMSFVALSIDAMLPALPDIALDLNMANPNDSQLIISAIFIGMGFGLLIFGPISDSYGRKPAIYLGMSIYIVGCLMSLLAHSFPIVIAGRILQGFGGASCRVITGAIIRDKYSGKRMAKVTSLAMIVFITVPAIAPSLGQAILFFGGWRYIFAFMLVLAISCLVWFAQSQEESLPLEKRVSFSLVTIGKGAKETLSHPISRGYTLAAALAFAAFVGYLNSSQQLFVEIYHQEKLFPVLFGVLALAIGSASFANSRWVERLGMKVLCRRALTVQVITAFGFMPYCLSLNQNPPLVVLMIYLGVTFFCLGLLFGNFTALALQPMGHIAGVANSVMGAAQTTVSVVIGTLISYSFNGTVVPLVTGFLICGLASLSIVVKLDKAGPEEA